MLTLHAPFISYMQYHIDQCDESKGETYRLAKELGQQLLENCREALAENPLYKDGMSFSTTYRMFVIADFRLRCSHLPDCTFYNYFCQGRHHLCGGRSRKRSKTRAIRPR